MPNDSERSAGTRSRRIDLMFLALVVILIVGAVLFRGAPRTERGPPTPAGPSPAAPGRAGAAPFAVPGARDAVKRDLRNLATAQEMFFSDSARYAKDVSELQLMRGLALTSGAHVRITWGSPAGWAAVADGWQLGGSTCVVRIGAVPDSVRPRTKLQNREGLEAEPRCDGDP